MKFAVILFSIAGITLLYFLSLQTEPFVVSDIDGYEGRYVRVYGNVVGIEQKKYGCRVEVKNDTLFSVWMQECEGISYGDKLRIDGKVQRYKNQNEIVVTSWKLEEEKEAVVSIFELASNPEKWEGKKVKVAGEIQKVYKRVFYITDGKYSLRIEKEESMGITEEKFFLGRFIYDPFSMRYQLILENAY